MSLAFFYKCNCSVVSRFSSNFHPVIPCLYLSLNAAFLCKPFMLHIILSLSPCHAPCILHVICPHFGNLCQNRHSKSVTFSTINQFCFTLTAVAKPVPICGRPLWPMYQRFCPPCKWQVTSYFFTFMVL